MWNMDIKVVYVIMHAECVNLKWLAMDYTLSFLSTKKDRYLTAKKFQKKDFTFVQCYLFGFFLLRKIWFNGYANLSFASTVIIVYTQAWIAELKINRFWNLNVCKANGLWLNWIVTNFISFIRKLKFQNQC